MKNKLVTVISAIAYCITILIASLLLLEIVYRNQFFDFYSVELNALNSQQELHSSKKKILILGDSFGAQQESYIQLLKDSLPGFSVVNSSVPGTSAREMSYLAKSRIAQFNPDKIIIQLYVGNDLIDIKHPVNFQEISCLRNLYWFMADKFSSLAWVNYKLGALRTRLDSEQKFVVPSNTDSFSVANYNGRVKLLIRADKKFISRSVLLSDENYRCAFRQLTDYISAIETRFHQTHPQREIILVCIPHCSEVNQEYEVNYKKLGAVFDRSQQNGLVNFYSVLKSKFQDFTFVNVIDSLSQTERNGTAVYFKNDEHLNKKGQQIVGQQILHQLQ